jgi:hypothetical protein
MNRVLCFRVLKMPKLVAVRIGSATEQINPSPVEFILCEINLMEFKNGRNRSLFRLFNESQQTVFKFPIDSNWRIKLIIAINYIDCFKIVVRN